jgi:hypothetical protein
MLPARSSGLMSLAKMNATFGFTVLPALSIWLIMAFVSTPPAT